MSGDLELAGELRDDAEVLRGLITPQRSIADRLEAAATRLEGLRDGVLEEAAQAIRLMTKRHCDPNGTDYQQGGQDHGNRCYAAIKRLKAAKPPTDLKSTKEQPK